jgi:lantibiotic biosynthesis protein
VQQGSNVLRRAAVEVVDKGEFDVISGRAGAIAALLILRAMIGDASLLECAMRLGDDLLETAVASEAGVSWAADPHLRNRHNLTGFSHGTSGVAFALLELGVASGESKYSSVGQSAFRYERHWFSPEARNWPDFREQRLRSRRGKQRAGFATFWCHGAPGIALSRLRAYALLGDGACREEAVVALETTRHNVESTLRDGRGNFSLCHGLTGNSDALLYGYETLGPGCDDLMSASQTVAQVGRERFASARAPWPCGTHSGETPGLMLGLAGIGHFYLRLHDPAVRRILILCDDQGAIRHKPFVRSRRSST